MSRGTQHRAVQVGGKGVDIDPDCWNRQKGTGGDLTRRQISMSFFSSFFFYTLFFPKVQKRKKRKTRKKEKKGHKDVKQEGRGEQKEEQAGRKR